MFQSFRRADFDSLAKLWSNYYPDRYRVDPELLKLNTVDCPVFDWGASLIYAPDGPPLGFAVVKKSGDGRLYPGNRRDDSFLCAIAYNEPKVAIDLLAEVKMILRDRGVRWLHFGQDAWHFFPGCPQDFAPLHDMLMVEGFGDGAEAFDMERDLSHYQALKPISDGFSARPLKEDDISDLEKFLWSEFPGRWAYDVPEKVKREGCPGCVVGLFEDDKIEGFARLQKWDDHVPMAGGVWRHALGDHWGSLGPIGIARHLRGRGLGHDLLGSALTYLKELGVRQCVIDWTDLRQLYERHGFDVSRRYRHMSLDLDAAPAPQSIRRDVGLS